MIATSTIKDRKEYARQYYLKNRDRLLEYAREYAATNPTQKKMYRAKRHKECREKISEIKRIRGCGVCDESDPRCLDFHHRDPKTKVMCVSQMSRYPWNTILVEIEKCDVLCANCHRKVL